MVLMILLSIQKGVFLLEVNPAGQWLWMEEKLNLNISRSIAEALMLSSD